jgi:hypothetical protein
MYKTHNKARNNRTASCAGLAHSSLACACGRYGYYMKIQIFLILTILPFCANSGSLFSFDRHDVLLSALSQIEKHYPELAKKGLKPRPYPLKPELNKEKKLVVSATFSYEDLNEFGLLFVCAKVDENGELIDIQRDIKAKIGFFNSPVPATHGCWGKP